ncbi:sensor domain-containing protein [Promicromonospora sp. NPDC023805]|uniref:sensor histidine kinase n=1 Tax=Promicromonospora sp. NPDC023805 TaxID=3154696 RepID=UPI0033FFCA79
MPRSDRLALALRRPGYLVSRWLPQAWLFTSLTAFIAGPLGALGLSGVMRWPTTFWEFALLLATMLATMLVLSPLIARLDRGRVRRLGSTQIADPHAPTELGGLRRVVFRLREPATWREVAYVAVVLPIGWVAASLHIAAAWAVSMVFTVPRYWMNGDLVWFDNPTGAVLGLLAAIVAIPALGYVLGLLALVQAALAQALLAPRGPELRRQIERLTASRTSLVRSFEGDLRRIERDLHDGVQQKLVTLTIALGSAELDAGELARAGVDVERLHRHLGRAHDLAEAALEDLRSTVRAIHPRVLADHGLTAAVHELTSRMPVPVVLASTVEDRFDPEIELCAYFIVSEALTNVARHSQAGRARVVLARDDGLLTVRVHDDGLGGADFGTGAGSGTGLVGLRERAEAAGGSLTVTSPPGGPTTVGLLLPARARAAGPDAGPRPVAPPTAQPPSTPPTVTETV